MTSVLTRVRMAAAVLPVAAALALTGCSSDGDDDSKDKAKPTPEASAPAGDASETPGSEETGDSGMGDGKGLEGSWLSTKDGNAVALVVSKGQAGLFASGGSVCSGTAGEKSGMEMVELTCTDGNTDRNEGHVKSVDEKSLTVSWKGFGEETFQRTEGGKLPTGMPTAPPAS